MPDTIQALVEKFVQDVEVLIRREALANVRSVLETSLGSATTAGSKPSNRASTALKKATEPVQESGQKRRTAKEIESDANRLIVAIKAKPGLTSEQLKTVARIMPKDFGLPIAKLLREKRIKKTGHKRSTKYFPA